MHCNGRAMSTTEQAAYAVTLSAGELSQHQLAGP